MLCIHVMTSHMDGFQGSVTVGQRDRGGITIRVWPSPDQLLQVCLWLLGNVQLKTFLHTETRSVSFPSLRDITRGLDCSQLHLFQPIFTKIQFRSASSAIKMSKRLTNNGDDDGFLLPLFPTQRLHCFKGIMSSVLNNQEIC